jgi:hypothetical protein
MKHKPRDEEREERNTIEIIIGWTRVMGYKEGEYTK